MPSKQKSPRSEARRPVWAEVSLGALAHNLAAIRNYVNPPGEKRKAPRKILSIVKGNGYGHGRGHASFHLKIDTGMNRLGIAPSDVDCFAQQLGKCKHLRLTGIFSHFASSGVFTDTAAGKQTREQEERFYAALDRLRALGIDPGLVHLANSAAIVSRPETWADMVRPGAILYGYHPGYDPAEKREEAEKLLPLEPVMSLHTKIIHLRRVPAGAGVGYDATFVPKRPSLIGVLAAGYGDGIHRSLGNRGSVLVRGKCAPIVGIVSMDVTMIDVTDIEGVEVGDVATIYGTDNCGQVILA